MSDPLIKRALVSVSDKTGIVDFCRELASLGVEIFSTGGTLKNPSGFGRHSFVHIHHYGVP